MKILGISGSMRKGGNTTILVEKALEACQKMGADIDFVSLADVRVEYCQDCNHCIRNNDFHCAIDDDVAGILEKMKKTDALIIGSPTYFSAVSGKLKSLFDRTRPLRRDDFQLRGKIGGAIAVGGARNGGQEFTIRDIHNWMLLQEMLIVSDKKTAHFGGIGVGNDVGDVLRDEIGMTSTKNLAGKIVETLDRLK